MISIVLACNDEVKQELLKQGFVEKTVLTKWHGCESTGENKSKLEHELFKLQPYQFLVADYWGAGFE